MRLFGEILALFGISLMMMIGILGRLRQSPSTAAWITFVTSHNQVNFYQNRVNPNGTQLTTFTDTATYPYPLSWSSDGRSFLFSSYGDERGLYRMNVDGSSRRFIGNFGIVSSADWSPDGEWIAFQGKNEEGPDLYKIRPDGSDLTNLAVNFPNGSVEHPSWSPDGKWIAFFHRAFGSGASMPSIYRVRTDGSDLRMVIEDDYIQGYPQWSPAVEKEWTIGQLALVGAGLLIPILWRQKDRVY